MSQARPIWVSTLEDKKKRQAAVNRFLDKQEMDYKNGTEEHALGGGIFGTLTGTVIAMNLFMSSAALSGWGAIVIALGTGVAGYCGAKATTPCFFKKVEQPNDQQLSDFLVEEDLASRPFVPTK